MRRGKRSGVGEQLKKLADLFEISLKDRRKFYENVKSISDKELEKIIESCDKNSQNCPTDLSNK